MFGTFKCSLPVVREVYLTTTSSCCDSDRPEGLFMMIIPCTQLQHFSVEVHYVLKNVPDHDWQKTKHEHNQSTSGKNHID